MKTVLLILVIIQLYAVECQFQQQISQSTGGYRRRCRGRNLWRCDSGECVRESYKCDGISDCWDSSDEQNCPSSRPECPSSKFQCGNGQCIPESYKCDGIQDCADFTDEISCFSKDCGPRRRMCTGVKKCVPLVKVCDGRDDCGDNSDEQNCWMLAVLICSENSTATTISTAHR